MSEVMWHLNGRSGTCSLFRLRFAPDLMLSLAPSALSPVAPISSSIRQSQILMSLTPKLHIGAKFSELLIVILSANTSFNKYALKPADLASFFIENDKLILKFIWNCKGPLISKTTLKMYEVGGPTLPDFKTYYRLPFF